MEDYFAVMGVPIRPWLDPQTLKERFFELSAETHPDHFHTASQETRDQATRDSTRLNAAYQCLSDPKRRLGHILELETGQKPQVVQQTPGEIMELFLEVGRLCQETDRFLDEKRQLSSPLLKARHFKEALTWVERIKTLQQTLQEHEAQVTDELKSLNPHWEHAPELGSADRPDSLPLRRLEELYRLCSHLTRWHTQLQERSFQLSQ